MSSVNVRVVADDIFEGDETFNVIMSIPSSVGRGITAGSRDNVIVTITDSTSEYCILHNYSNNNIDNTL